MHVYAHTQQHVVSINKYYVSLFSTESDRVRESNHGEYARQSACTSNTMTCNTAYKLYIGTYNLRRGEGCATQDAIARMKKITLFRSLVRIGNGVFESTVVYISFTINV